MPTRDKSTFKKILSKHFCDSITPPPRRHFRSFFLAGKKPTLKILYRCPLCSYILSIWPFCENCAIIDDSNEKCRLFNPCKLHRGYAVQIKNYNSCLDAVKIKNYNSCLEDASESHTRSFLCSNCNYDKRDQWVITYPSLIEQKPKRDLTLFLSRVSSVSSWFQNSLEIRTWSMLQLLE